MLNNLLTQNTNSKANTETAQGPGAAQSSPAFLLHSMKVLRVSMLPLQEASHTNN